MEKELEIQLVTKPKIAHQLQKIGASVAQRLEDLNINNLVATEDTVKSLKQLRADLNKELGDYEDQRKFVKNGILNPYNEFEELYKKEISERYKSAIDTLKDKIGIVETKIKDEKKTKVKSYYDELCLSEKIDFIPFEKLGLDINLTASEKSLKTKCDEFIKKILDDLTLIRTSDYEAETMTEYKATLNVASAITTVKIRKENERAEAERIKQAEITSRIQKTITAGLKYDEFSKTYLYNDQIFITDSFLKESSKDEFTQKLIECTERIKVLTAPSGQAEMNFAAPTSTPLAAPVKKENTAEEIVTASFKVSGTMSQLKALGQFMKDHQITYINI